MRAGVDPGKAEDSTSRFAVADGGGDGPTSAEMRGLTSTARDGGAAVIITDKDENDGDGDGDGDGDNHLLGDRVCACVRRCPNLTIRPGRLAAELGISIDDASAELCGLLAAVGGGEGGATFTFETLDEGGDGGGEGERSDCKGSRGGGSGGGSGGFQAVTMVFTFPPDFERRSRSYRRRRDFRAAAARAFVAGYKVFRAAVSFLLIVSIAVLALAALVAFVAATIAMARGRDRHHGGHHFGMGARYLRSLVLSLRELMWFYVLFGNDDDIRDSARNVGLWMSMCFSSPMHLGFWLRAGLLSRRRRFGSRRRGRMGRSWAGSEGSSRARSSDIEGVAMVVPGEWGRDNGGVGGGGSGSRWRRSDDSQGGGTPDHFRGLLSILIEFMFGPDDQFAPRPSEADRWRLRARFIVNRAGDGARVALEDLIPWVDSPPPTLKDPSRALLIVSHFNGIPCQSGESVGVDDGESGERTGQKRVFRFPELVMGGEASTTTSPTERGPFLPSNRPGFDDDDNASFFSWKRLEPILYDATGAPSSSAPAPTNAARMDSHLVEEKRVLTRLKQEEFAACVGLGIVNFFGVWWFGSSLSGGELKTVLSHYPLVRTVLGAVAWFLGMYAKLFFVLVLGRIFVLLVLNWAIERRNRSRASLARQLGCGAASAAVAPIDAEGTGAGGIPLSGEGGRLTNTVGEGVSSSSDLDDLDMRLASLVSRGSGKGLNAMASV